MPSSNRPDKKGSTCREQSSISFDSSANDIRGSFLASLATALANLYSLVARSILKSFITAISLVILFAIRSWVTWMISMTVLVGSGSFQIILVEKRQKVVRTWIGGDKNRIELVAKA